MTWHATWILRPNWCLVFQLWPQLQGSHTLPWPSDCSHVVKMKGPFANLNRIYEATECSTWQIQLVVSEWQNLTTAKFLFFFFWLDMTGKVDFFDMMLTESPVMIWLDFFMFCFVFCFFFSSYSTHTIQEKAHWHAQSIENCIPGESFLMSLMETTFAMD